MIKKILFALTVAVCSAGSIFAQVAPTPTSTRQRVFVVGSSQNQTNPQSSPTPTPTPAVPAPIPSGSPVPSTTPKKIVVITNNVPAPAATPVPLYTPRPQAFPSGTPGAIPSDAPASVPVSYLPLPTNFRKVSLGELRSKLNETRRQLQTRPMPTAMTDSFLVTDIVRLGYFDWNTNRIDFITVTKSSFLQKDGFIPTTTDDGKNVTLRVYRPNYVNTSVVIIDEKNQAHTPLMVQYPIEKYGRLVENAYYISAHPGLSTPEVVNAGKFYVRNVVDTAREKLRQKGLYISPQIADIAERLSTVEHVDHERFRNEIHQNIYNDIFTLYALNEGNTYRYSVSSAGAGGMVQMIPSTYQMVRSRYYTVGLIPDFVEGMRNHVNAMQAMLLYMQWNWNDLSANETVMNALDSGIATQSDLMAAGYNSNPARLASYIKRGGENWRALIPRETKIYLQIYSSLERNVPMIPRTK